MRKFALDFVLFVASAISAVAFDWSAKDLVWGLWLSCLVVGYSTIVIGIAAAAISRPRELLEPPGPAASDAPTVAPRDVRGFPPLARAGLALGILAFFTVHFGLFHVVHGLFLGAFFPLTDAKQWDFGFASLWRNAGAILATGWPLAATSVLGSLDRFRAALRRFDFTTPYRSVVRMHFFIIGYGALHALRVGNAAVYVIVLAIYWFPFEEVRSTRFVRVTRRGST